jgi:type IV pilus assembly protein PilX
MNINPVILKPLNRHGLRAQRGATLLVCLLLLLGLTVVGIASMRETVVQQKAINMAREDDTSFQAAEFALRTAEAFVITRTRTSGKFLHGSTVNSVTLLDGKTTAEAPGWWKNRDDPKWDSGPSVTMPLLDAANQRAPSYVVEMFEDGQKIQQDSTDANSVVNYRITARGFGVNDAYYTVLQSTVGVAL